MASLDLTALDDALKVFYLDSIKEQINNSSVLYNQLDKDDMVRTADGKSFTLQLHIGRNKSAALGNSDGGTFQTADVQKYDTCLVPNKYLYTIVEITGPAMHATKTSAGSAVDAVDSEIQGAVRDAKRAINRQINGNGTDALAFWTAADDTSGFTVDDGRGNAFTYLESGTTTCDLIDATDNATVLGADMVVTLGAEGASSYAITSTVNPSGSAAGDYLVHANTLGYQMMGIEGIINNADPPLGDLQGLDAATFPWWNAQVVTATGSSQTGTKADVSVELLQRPITRLAVNSDYAKNDISFMFSNMFVQDKYAAYASDLKRIVNETELDAGWTGINFNGLVWVTDPMCKRNVVYYIVKDALKFVRTADFTWREKSGSVLHPLETSDKYRAVLFTYMNLATTARNGLAKLQWIAD